LNGPVCCNATNVLTAVDWPAAEPSLAGQHARNKIGPSFPRRFRIHPPATMSQLSLTRRDAEVVQALVQKVRLFSQRQLAAAWWHGDMGNARRRLGQLRWAELVERIDVQARTLGCMSQPLVVWQPGQMAPNFGQVAYQCQSRWQRRALRSCAAWIATVRSAQLFGGASRGELKHPTQASHDLGVAAVWLRLRATAPTLAESWRGEDLLAHSRHGAKLPDAFIVDNDERVTTAIEFGGAYDAIRVREFHEDCDHRGLPYQLW
jgi:hypothetical protein